MVLRIFLKPCDKRLIGLLQPAQNLLITPVQLQDLHQPFPRLPVPPLLHQTGDCAGFSLIIVRIVVQHSGPDGIGLILFSFPVTDTSDIGPDIRVISHGTAACFLQLIGETRRAGRILLRKQETQTLHLLIRMPDTKRRQIVQLLRASLEFIPVRLFLHRKIVVQIAVHILFPRAPAPEIFEPDEALMSHVIFDIIQKILWKFLFQKFDVFHNLKVFIQQLPYLLRQIDMIHQIGQKPLSGLQRRIQTVTDRILQKLPPRLLIGAVVYIAVALVDPVDPRVNRSLFLRTAAIFRFRLIIRLRGKCHRSLVRSSQAFKALRVVFRIRLLQKLPVSHFHGVLILRLFDTQDMKTHFFFHKIPCLTYRSVYNKTCTAAESPRIPDTVRAENRRDNKCSQSVLHECPPEMPPRGEARISKHSRLPFCRCRILL